MEKYIEILNERFSKDSLIALATVDENNLPWVRTIDAVFIKDSFYTITYALSNKIKHINNNHNVAISGEWFSGHAKAINLGHIKLCENNIGNKYLEPTKNIKILVKNKKISFIPKARLP